MFKLGGQSENSSLMHVQADEQQRGFITSISKGKGPIEVKSGLRESQSWSPENRAQLWERLQCGFFSGTFFAVSPAIWKTNGGNGHYQTRGIYLKTPGSIDGDQEMVSFVRSQCTNKPVSTRSVSRVSTRKHVSPLQSRSKNHNRALSPFSFQGCYS